MSNRYNLDDPADYDRLISLNVTKRKGSKNIMPISIKGGPRKRNDYVLWNRNPG